MLVYLFQRNAGLALTREVTGRNLPCRTAASPWVFVEAQYQPPLSAEALRHLHQVGYYIL